MCFCEHVCMCMCVGLNDYSFGLVLPCAYILVRESKYSHYNFSSLWFFLMYFFVTPSTWQQGLHLSHSDINQCNTLYNMLHYLMEHYTMLYLKTTWCYCEDIWKCLGTAHSLSTLLGVRGVFNTNWRAEYQLSIKKRDNIVEWTTASATERDAQMDTWHHSHSWGHQR